MAFYKNNNGSLIKGNHIINADYELSELSEKTNLPDNWNWFETDDEAYLFFGIEKPMYVKTGKPISKIV